tara:strand:+ start:2386 stop:4059 length:1674 start_codon:yes stop_codon:yes gene_type:complete
MSKSKNQPIILPEKYYHQYFIEVLAFVQKYSAHLMGPAEELFIRDFNKLGLDAQCLFIRFSNRRGPYFRLDKLKYDEISSIEAATKELEVSGFISRELDPDEKIFKVFTKAELKANFVHLDWRKQTKDDAILQLKETQDYVPILTRFPLIEVVRQEILEYIKMLYFGRYKKQMTEFVIRDIGHIKLEALDETQFTPWFESRKEALAAFELYKLSSLVRSALSEITAAVLHDALSMIPWEEYLLSPKTHHIGDRMFLLIGKQLEREEAYPLALSYYQLATKHPARERQIRILNRLGEVEKAKSLAINVMEQHWNPSECLFAKDFLDKKNIRITRSTSKRLSEAASIEISLDTDQSVEHSALLYYEKLGFQGIHGENYLWKSLFGLLLWDQLFDQKHGAYHNPIQRSASDLYTKSFYEKRKDEILRILKSFRSKKSMIISLENRFEEKYGIANPMVYWNSKIKQHLVQLISQLPFQALKKILIEMSKNLKDHSTGFPDLFIWKKKEYHLYEIKSPNDHLSSQQLFWLNFMQSQGVYAEIIRVHYKAEISTKKTSEEDHS